MATRHRSTCATTSFAKFLRLCRKAMLALPALGLLIQPVYAQTWLGVTDNGTAGEFNWTEPTNWSTNPVIPNAVGATATFGAASPGGNIILDAPITLGTLNFFSGAVYTVQGGANQLTFDQGGAGLIDIDAGDVTIAADIAMTAGGLDIDVLGAPVVNAEISGIIGGSGPVDKLGVGTLVLSGANTYTNATVITAGTLQLGVAGAIPDGSAVSVAAAATFDLNNFDETIGSLSGAGSVLLGTGNLTTGGNNNNTTFSGVISEDGDLIKEGTGVFTLSGVNTYTGDTVLNAGTLSIGSGANLGSTMGDIVFNGGELQTTASTTISHEVVFNAGGGTVDTPLIGNTTLFTGDFTGTGTLNKDGFGTMQISNNLTAFGGNINIIQGVVENITIGTETFSGDLTGQGDFIKSGPGILNLSGNNNAHVGNVFITAGRLRSQNPGVIGDVSNVILSAGATLDLNNNDEVMGGLFGAAGSTVVLNGANLTTSNDMGVNDSVFDGVITGNANSELIKVGDGSLTLGGMNTFEGTTRIQEGQIIMSADDVFANRMALEILTDAVLDMDGFSDTIGPLSGNGDVMMDAGSLTVNSENSVGGAANSTFSGRIFGTGDFTKTGSGVLTFSGANEYTGDTTINAGTLRLGADDRIDDVSDVIVDNTLATGATFDLNNFNERIASLAGNGFVTLGTGSLSTGAGASTMFDGVISGTGGLIKEGASTFTLGGMNTYTGPTQIDGGILQLMISDALADTTAVTVAAGATLDLNTFDVSDTIGSLSGAGSVTLDNGTLTTGGDNTSTMFSGVISSTGAGGLTKEGTGTFTLSGVNTYMGATTVNAGTLQLGIADALPDGTAVTVATGAILDLNDFSDTIASLSGAGSVDLGTGTLTTGDATNTEFSGVISGTGGIVKEGTGTFTLSGINTYSGGTDINDGILLISNDNNLGATGPGIGQLGFDGGTLAISADVTSARDVTLNAGGGTVDTNTFNATLSGIIDGAGGLTKEGTGTLTLTGMNTYMGGTTINDGTVSVGADNNLGDPTGPLTFDGGTLLTTAGIMSARDVTLNANGGTIDTNGFDSAFSGIFSGTGDLTKAGAGVLTLSGASTYTGDTFINAGILRLGDSGVLPDTTMVSVASGATFDLDGFDETIGSLSGVAGSMVTLGNGTLTTGDATPLTEFAGVISGSGGLTKQGTGIFRLSGVNTYTGPTTINDGTLELAINDALADQTAVTVNMPGNLSLIGTVSDTIGSLAGDGTVMLGTGTLTTGADNTSTLFSGVISGAGSVVKVGTGTWTLTGINTYLGGTAINGGTVAISDDSNLGDPSGGLSFDGGTLLTNAAIMSARDVVLNAGGGTIDTNGFDSTFSGIFSGPGQLTKDGAGTLVLSGVNTYTGGTAINGGILSVGSDVNLGGPMGPIIFNGGTLLTTGPVTSARSISVNILGGTIDTNGFDSSFSGPVVGPGDFTKAGAGTLTFSGPLMGYTGNTTIMAGILEVDTTADNTSLSGDISGPGGLTKTGLNTLTLTGNLDAYTGDTVIDNGILEIDTTAGNTMLNGAVSGAGNLTKSGLNTLTLNGMGTWTGATLIEAGTLQLGTAGAVGDMSAVTVEMGATFDLAGFDEVIGSLAGAGDVTLGAGTLTTGGNDTSTEFSGVISGTGGIVKEGTGVFTLSGVNTYTGGTTINEGTVAVTNDNNLGGPAGPLTFDGGTLLTNAGIASARDVTLLPGGGTIDTNGFDSLFSGVFSGTGRLTKEGLGTLTLSGMNTYTGGTTINEGIVSISSDANLGTPAPAGPLTFDGGTLLTTGDVTSARVVTLLAGGGTIDTNGFNTIMGGIISGPGGLTKEGPGTLSLTNFNTYTGDTTVNGGRLDVDGSITSDTTVNTGATLGGNGTIFGNVTIADGGTMAPGNSIGQTNVVGTYTQGANSIFELEVRPAPVGAELPGIDFDQTNVTGNIIIEPGATVNVVPQAGTYELGNTFRFLDATGTRMGTYDMLNGATFNGGLLNGQLFYDANGAELRITNTNFANLASLQSKNQQSMARALDSLSAIASTAPGSDAANVINQLLVMPPPVLQAAVAQIGGVSHGTNRTIALQSTFDYMQAVRNRVRTDLVNKEENGDHPFWVQGLGTYGTLESDGNATGAEYDGRGMILGFDQGLTSGRQGVTIGFSDVDIDNLNGLDTAGLQNYNITAYSSTIANPVYLIGMIGFAHNEVDATRQLTALNPNRTAMSETTNNQFMGLLEYGLYANTALWDFQAYVSGQYVSLHQDGFTEFNAASMNLGVADNSVDSFRSIVGMRLSGRLTTWFEPEANLGFIHEFMDPNANNIATFNNTNVSFAQCGVALPRDLGQLGVGGTFRIKDCVSFYAGYDAMLSSQQSAHAVGGTLILNY